MRKLLNTLYVTTPNAYLSKDGQNIVVSVEQEEVFRIPAINIEAIVTFGYVGASPGLMKLCADSGIGLSFLSPSGHFIGRLQGPIRGNVLLRRVQYSFADDEQKSLQLVKDCIAAKVHNQRYVLKRYTRDYGSNPVIDSILVAMEKSQRDILRDADKASVRGHEGDAASQYFSVFHYLILNGTEFPFSGRNRRPPKDAVNAMLSLAYTLLTNDITSALESVGLDPYVGFFHTQRPGRTSLSLDLIEELRAYFCDRFVLSLINRRQVTKSDFLFQGDQGVILTDSGRRTFITAWQNRKKETITHPFLQEKIELGILPYVQALLLARFIRGDIDAYPVFLCK